jgi:hypothetical protein
VFLVSLNIASKLEANMFVVVEMSAKEKVVGGKGISMWEPIEPKYSITDQMYDHETWDLLKREGVIPTASSIFNSMDVSFDLGDLLVLSTQIKADVPKHVLQRREFGVGIHDGDLETRSIIYVSHLFKACSHTGDMMVQQIFDCPKM